MTDKNTADEKQANVEAFPKRQQLTKVQAQGALSRLNEKIEGLPLDRKTHTELFQGISILDQFLAGLKD